MASAGAVVVVLDDGGGVFEGQVLRDAGGFMYVDNGKLPVQFEYLRENRYVSRDLRRRAKGEDYECMCTAEKPCNDETCQNRSMCVECAPDTCPCGALCQNQRFQKRQYARTVAMETPGKGWGLFASSAISKGTFIIEYCGEVIETHQYFKRSSEMDAGDHFYFMQIKNSIYLDASRCGNEARFMNHSCIPNCRTEKWIVRGRERVGFFAVRDVAAGEELTFDYNFEWYGQEPQRCCCGAPTCRGTIGIQREMSKHMIDKWDDLQTRETARREQRQVVEEIVSLRPPMEVHTLLELAGRFLRAEADDLRLQKRILECMLGMSPALRTVCLQKGLHRFFARWVVHESVMMPQTPFDGKVDDEGADAESSRAVGAKSESGESAAASAQGDASPSHQQQAASEVVSAAGATPAGDLASPPTPAPACESGAGSGLETPAGQRVAPSTAGTGEIDALRVLTLRLFLQVFRLDAPIYFEKLKLHERVKYLADNSGDGEVSAIARQCLDQWAPVLALVNRRIQKRTDLPMGPPPAVMMPPPPPPQVMMMMMQSAGVPLTGFGGTKRAWAQRPEEDEDPVAKRAEAIAQAKRVAMERAMAARAAARAAAAAAAKAEDSVRMVEEKIQSERHERLLQMAAGVREDEAVQRSRTDSAPQQVLPWVQSLAAASAAASGRGVASTPASVPSVSSGRSEQIARLRSLLDRHRALRADFRDRLGPHLEKVLRRGVKENLFDKDEYKRLVRKHMQAVMDKEDEAWRKFSKPAELALAQPETARGVTSLLEHMQARFVFNEARVAKIRELGEKIIARKRSDAGAAHEVDDYDNDHDMSMSPRAPASDGGGR